MKTKLEIIEETVKYYSEDTNRRAVVLSGSFFCSGNVSCKYLNEYGNRCAVGRCLIPDTYIIKEGNEYSHADAKCTVWTISNLNDILKEEYRGHDKDFWADLQTFHDDCDNWTDDGLSDMGKEVYNQLLKDWA